MSNTNWYESTEWAWVAAGLKCPNCGGPVRVTKFIPESSFLTGVTFRCVPRPLGCGRGVTCRMHIDVNHLPTTEMVQREIDDPPAYGDVRVFEERPTDEPSGR